MLVALNPIILKTLERYLDDNPEIPHQMGSLIEDLLQLESQIHNTSQTGGLDKLYDQILAKYVSHKEFVDWSKDYVKT